MPGYNARYWAERTPVSKRPKYPVLRGDHSADVVIIGGGLTGAMAACVLARGGLDVILVEAERVASGATAAGMGAVIPQPEASFVATSAALGLRATRTAWKETRASALDLAAALKRIGIKCDASPAPAIVNATVPEVAVALKREQTKRRAAGLPAPWLTAAAVGADIGTDTAGGVRLAESMVIDPVKATLGFLSSAQRAGARIFEKSAVRRTRFTRTSAEVVLAGGVVKTEGVYVATGHPGTVFRQLRRHVRDFETYTVVTEPLTAAMKRETGRRAVVLTEAPDLTYWLRWLKDGRAMFSGAPGPVVGARLQDRVLTQRTGQLMYRTFATVSRHVRVAGKVELGHTRRHDDGWSAVDRNPSESSVPLLCAGARWTQRGVLLVCREGRPPALHRGAPPRRRRLRLYPVILGLASDQARRGRALIRILAPAESGR